MPKGYPKDCRIECRSTPPLDRQTQTQIGAFTGSMAMLGLVASAGKRPAVRAVAAAGGAAAGAAAATVLASYIARRRCEAVCEALNKLAAGEQLAMDWWLQSSIRWFVAWLQHPGACGDTEFGCWALMVLAPYV